MACKHNHFTPQQSLKCLNVHQYHHKILSNISVCMLDLWPGVISATRVQRLTQGCLHTVSDVPLYTVVLETFYKGLISPDSLKLHEKNSFYLPPFLHRSIA
ncbi:hypothetical protein EXN66_Car016679 [Channa argus]|uniref:Uncharacterized protein n=1 Tax=Channa argus TaxID=215402 RepID=A0A6G1QEA9_CHAAH|nr:hypothetical protein EXN66_Car016679 [Channa argus]